MFYICIFLITSAAVITDHLPSNTGLERLESSELQKISLLAAINKVRAELNLNLSKHERGSFS